MSWVQEFREFAMKGNMLDLAVGVIIGAAFGKIIDSLVKDIIMPLIGLVMGGVNFKDLVFVLKPASLGAQGELVPPLTLNYGMFLQSLLDFLIIAFSIFWAIKLINRFRSGAVAEETKIGDPDVVLLSDIKEILQHQSEAMDQVAKQQGNVMRGLGPA